MAKKSRLLDEERVKRLFLRHTQHLMEAKLDILTLQTALINKGVITTADLARAVEIVTAEQLKSLDDPPASPEKPKESGQGKKFDVQ